jgi:1,4-dihydroxy-2-naphthoyl-CoA hydrolase
LEQTEPLDARHPPTAGLAELIGLELTEATPDRVTGWLDAGPEHHQPMGLVHGGVHCAVVETLASIGAYLNVHEQGLDVVGVSNATDFLRPHRRGRLDAVAEPIHVGRTQQLWQAVITRASDGKVVARGQVRLQNVPTDTPTGHAR